MKKVLLTASIATFLLATSATAFAATNHAHTATLVPAHAQVQINDSTVIGYIYKEQSQGDSSPQHPSTPIPVGAQGQQSYTKTPLTLGEFKDMRLQQMFKDFNDEVFLGKMTQQQFDAISSHLKAEFTNWNGLTSTISYVGMDGKTYFVPPFKQWNPGDPAEG
jgi:hypothetical protein